jgi:hypothetical protein
MTHSPNDLAFERMNRVAPEWSALRPLACLPCVTERMVLHAGPRHDSGNIPLPVRNSIAMVALREGWASSPEAALNALDGGEITLAPAQDFDVFIPLAGAAGPSTLLIEVTDRNGPGRAYSPLNEGMVLCTRLGIAHPDLPDHLRWVDKTLGPWLWARLGTGALELFPILRAALAAGDDCHSRTMAGSQGLLAALVARRTHDDPAVQTFLEAAPAFALNVWMAMCGLIAGAAQGIPGATLVTRAGGNGRDFGFQLADAPGQWQVSPAPAIRGTVDPKLPGATALAAMGDSALVDVMGLGGQALSTAPAVVEALRPHLPGDALTRGTGFLHGVLDGFGTRAATDAARVRASGIGPLILLGMIDADGRRGRIGGGCVATTAAGFA